jgi:CelD/BcsL family acetyltransferase involved in cellulose biosynthesis
MRTPTVLHWWLPAFDPAQGALSPGQLSFLEVARAAAADGVKRVDLGKGTEPYKTRLMSGSIMVAEGAIHLSPPVGAMWRTRYRAMEWARRSPLRGMLREPARWLRRVMAARNG